MSRKPPEVEKVDDGVASSPVAEALKLITILTESSALGLAADEQSFEDESSRLAVEDAISQAEFSARLRIAVELAATRSNNSMEALRAAVCAFTVALRSEGVAPEGVLIRLKAAIREETLSPLWITSTWSGPRLRDSIVTWCIQDYFRDDDCAN